VRFQKEALAIWMAIMLCVTIGLWALGIEQEVLKWKTSEVLIFVALVSVGVGKVAVIVAIFRDKDRNWKTANGKDAAQERPAGGTK
jgi:hypothetical protein